MQTRSHLFLTLIAITLASASIAQTWSPLTPAFTGGARKGAIAFSIGTKGYIGLGETAGGQKMNDLWQFNPTTYLQNGQMVWTQMANFPGTARTHAVGFALLDQGYVGTGEDANGRTSDFYRFDPTIGGGGGWSAMQSLPGPARSEAVGFALGDKGYAGLGANAMDASDFYEYDTSTETWYTRAEFPGGQRSGAVGFGIQFHGFVGTGRTGTTLMTDFWLYIPPNVSAPDGTWVERTPFPGSARSGSVGFSMVGYGFVALGNDGTLTDDVFRYNPDEDEWHQDLYSFLGGARDGAIAFSIDDRGYVGMGAGGSGLMNDLWDYRLPIDCVTHLYGGTHFPGSSCNDGNDGTILDHYSESDCTCGGTLSNWWVSRPDMQDNEHVPPIIADGRLAAVSFTIGNRAYIGLGQTTTNPAVFTKDFWVYDRSTEAWMQAPTFPGVAVDGAVGFSINTNSLRGTLGYVGTGFGINQQSQAVLTREFWEFDELQQHWARKADLPAYSRQAAVGFSLGTVGYIGLGEDSLPEAQSHRLADFWQFYPEAQVNGNDEYGNPKGNWTPAAAFPGTARAGAVAFTVGGKGYVATGNDGFHGGGSSLNDLWEFNPAGLTGSWHQRTSLPGQARYNAVAFGLGSKGYLGTGEWHTPPVAPSINPQLHVTNDFWEFDPASDANGFDVGVPMGKWTQVSAFGGAARFGAVGFAMGYGQYAKGYIATGNVPLSSGNVALKKDLWEYTPTTDCLGEFQGTTRPGTVCDDHNQFTIGDQYNEACQCEGTCEIDLDGDSICSALDNCPNIAGTVGTPCDDGIECSVFDQIDMNCSCTGTLLDSDGDQTPDCTDNCPNAPGVYGSACDDGEPCTTGTTLNLACICTGGTTMPDTDGDGFCNAVDVCPNTPPDEIGSINSDGCSCGDLISQLNDNDPCTLDACVSGTITHTVQDADGDGTCDLLDPCPLLANKVPGDGCDDGDPCTVNETITAGCLCVGTNNTDTDGDGACDLIDPCPLLANLVPGDPCNDDSQSTSNDEVTNGCECLGTPLPPPSDWIYRGDDPLVNRRFGAVAFTIGDVAYFGGGADVNGATNDFYSYDPVNGWQSINDPIPGGPRIYSVAFSSGGKGYVGTGNDNLFYEYDPANGGSWTQVTEPLPGPVRVHATSFTINDMGYVGLGQTAGPVFFRDFYKFVPGPDPGSGTWVPIDEFPAHQVWLNGQFYDTGIAFATGFSVGGTGYVCGGAYDNTNGESFTPLNELWAYTPGSGWVPKASLPIGNRIFATSFSIGDKGYVGTGLSYPFALNDDFYEYDPALDTWTERDPYSGRRRSVASGFSINGKGYITGGASTGGYNSDLWEYDPIIEGGWTQRHAFNGGGRDGASSFSIGGMGYVFGGQNTETFFNDLWRYNPTTDSWTQSASMLDGAPRSFAMAFSIGNDGYVGTGRTASSGSNSIDYITDDFFRYDAVENQWTAIDAFPGGRRFGGTAFTIGGVAYAGMGDAGINDGGIQADIYKYDPTQGWSYSSLFGNGLGDGRAYASAFPTNDKGYVAMGATPNGSNSNELWQFDPVTNGWTPMLSCPGPGRFAASSFVVGELGYIVTGRDQQDLFNDAWEYNTTTGTWSERASPGPVARWGATAFAIGGIGYLTTGRYADGSYSVDTRMYTPSQEPDCLGITGGSALPGTPCDVDPCMIEQIWDANCTCTGGGPNLVDLDNDLLVDCTEQCPGTPFGEITNADGCSCSQLNTDDSDPCTTDNCVDGVVSHVPTDTDGDGIPDCTDSCPGLFGQEGDACGGTACLSPGTIVNCVCNATAINPQLGDTYATRIPITLDNAGNATVSGNNLPCFTSTYTGAHAQASPDVWYSITTGACAPGNMIVSLCGGGTSFDTYLHLLDASGTTQLAYNDDSGPICTGTKSSLSHAIAPNTTYVIVVEGYGAYTGTFTLDVSIPSLAADADSDGIPDGCDPCTPGLEYTVEPVTFAPLPNTGTAVTLADDQVSGALPIGFAFNFYGTSCTNFHISSNGWMTFTPGQQPAHAAQALPSPPSSTVPSNLIAAAWMDLNPAAGGSINYATTGTSPNQVLTVTWTAVPLYQNVTISATVQIQLHEGSNAIEIHSTSIPVTLFAKTQGIQNSNGTAGLASPGRNQTPWSATNDAYRFTPHATGPGASCNDGLASTTNDLLNSNCVCVGTPIGNGQPEIVVEQPVGNALSGVVAWGGNGSGQSTVPVAAQSGITAIAGGWDFSMALKSDGSVIAWGNNDIGQTDVPVSALSDVTAIAAGGGYSLALKGDGSVIAWGDNSYGQTNVPSSALTGVIAIAAAPFHCLALKSDGSVVAWGRNVAGEATPPPAAQNGVVAIAGGWDFSAALKSDGSVISWGTNNYGQSPAPLAAQAGVVAIATGYDHILALKDDGSVIAWGANGQGQTAVPPSALSSVTAIAASGYHSLALKSDGSVIAWGQDNLGQSAVPGVAQSGIASISAGREHSLGLKNALLPLSFGDQTVSTASAAKTFTIRNTGNANLIGITLYKSGANPGDFTLNTDGMLSTLPYGGSTTFSVTFTPGAVGARSCTLHIVSNDNNENPYDIDLTGNGVPLDTDGDGVPDATDNCPNVVGQIGSSCDDGNPSTVGDIRNANCTCVGMPTKPEIAVEQPAGNALSGVIAWGLNYNGQTTVPVAAQSGVSAVAAGALHTVALKSDGSVIAWGGNDAGQSTVPAQALSGVTAIAAGGYHTVALKGDGGVVAWGSNTFGQATVPTQAQSGVTAIAAGAAHTVALKNDGGVIAWGSNGNGESTVPLQAQSGVTSIAAGNGHTVALKNDGSVISWGTNNYGESTVPPEAQSGIIAIAAGNGWTAALKSDGSVIAWGYPSTTPVEALSGVSAIATSGNHVLALKSDGSVFGWRDNLYGQTTIPSTAQSGVTSISAGWNHSVALKNAFLPLGFGDQTVSTASVAKTFTIRNTGNASLIGIALNKTGANPADFTLDTGGMLSSLPPGGSTTFSVTFTPGAAGTRSCTLHIVSNDNNENPYDIELTGNGVITDSDGDGVPDADDICPGHPDNVDTDGDGIPDGCDSCPLGVAYAVAPIAYAPPSPIATALSNTGPASDDSYVSVPIGFNFKYYGTAYTSVYLVSNGYLAFTMPHLVGSIPQVPSPAFENGWVGYWADLNPTAGTVTYETIGTAPNRQFIANYRQVNYFVNIVTATPYYSGQVVLNEADNSIEVYVEHSQTTQMSVIGMENLSGTAGMSPSGRNAGFWAATNEAYRFTPAPIEPGSACDDGNACTTGDVVNGSCVCAGTFQDTDADGVCDASDNCPSVVGQIGSSCNDGNANTISDILSANCTCVGFTTSPEIVVEQPVGTALSGVVGWGLDSYGQTTVPAEAQTGVTAIAAGQHHTLALKSDGSVIAWGFNTHGQTNVPTAAQSGVVAIAAAAWQSFALKSDGNLIAWGDNSSGETNVPVAAQSGVVAIAAGEQHSLALKSDGSVIAWGSNSYGQTTVPTAAQSGVVAIAAGGYHSLALKGDGSVIAWGYNAYGQTNLPPAAQSGVVAIAAGGHCSLALKSDGSVIAWGYSAYGQTDLPPAAQSGVTGIIATFYHALALKGDGSVVAWGNNDFGQTNVPAAAQSGITSIDGGDHHSLVLKNALLPPAFGDQIIATTSAAKTFTIRNTGNADLTGLAITKTGAHPGDFTVNTGGMLTTVPPGGSTTFSVTFTPASIGARGATVHIASNDNNENPYDIDLTGNGVAAPNVQLAVKVLLEGPYNSVISLMSDALRAQSMLPLTEPYTGLGYSFVNGGGETTTTGVLQTTGSDAIVDWVIVELRPSSSNTTVSISTAALVQRDGDVVAMDGISPLSLATSAGDYYVVVRHRDHLGVMTAAPISLSATSTAVDLTLSSTVCYGTGARKTVGGRMVLWAGDVSGNGVIKYTGSANDRDPILVRVGSTTPNNSVSGYHRADVNMDGITRYTGSGNDRDPILVNVGSTTPNNIRTEQLP